MTLPKEWINPKTLHMAMYTGIVIFLGGKAFDNYWHAQNLSFVVEPPRKLLVIHSGIYSGALIVAITGLAGLFLAGRLLPGSAVMLVGALIQLTGIGLDFWAHSQGYQKALYHDMEWYGLAVIALAVVLTEYAAAARRRVRETPREEESLEAEAPQSR
ncbi:hypothetical protein E1264_19900 [Actinomadura sp. KC216]|uniref:hypothetical protein n=1 Tax=Actinomadura sp. KC216 TaxID=2530370 RepID=UPI0010482650|nr:hypothetical protein [Actinomadura sp. KC216]TDB85797.1 hypothetical protein E1264_19900 [Actinomadura sp. KC216]